MVKNLPANAGDTGSILGSGSPQEKKMAPHSSILAWEIPWTEGPGRLQSMGSQEPDTTEQLRFFPDVQPRLEPFKGYVAV